MCAHVSEAQTKATGNCENTGFTNIMVQILTGIGEDMTEAIKYLGDPLLRYLLNLHAKDYNVYQSICQCRETDLHDFFS